jgi:hypothetical protein
MATNYTQLAGEIATALGHPGNVTTQVLGFARGILEELTQSGSATFGNIPGPHSISGLTGSSMANRVKTYAGYPTVSSQLLGFCTGISTHVMTGVVTYTGPSSPTPPNWFLGGTISGMTGSGMANQVKINVPFPYVTSELLAMCQAIVSHIQTNAQVTSGVIS